ncbi:MAG: NAD(P)H-binding protein [Bacteroidia bacterium]|nr:NAD(P)H-binding protein [Bacteroidia bacterium]
MYSTDKIALLGATGKSGTYVLREVLRAGYPCRLLLRDPSKLQETHPLIEVVQGDARDPEALLHLLKGCTAVLSTLGQPAGESSIFSTATRNVLQAMERHGIRRYIVTTGLSVDLPGDEKEPAVQQATDWMKQHYPETTFDKQKEYEVLAASGVQWTLVRLPLIDLTGDPGQLQTDLHHCPWPRVSASGLAQFLLRQLKESTWHQKAPFAGNL